MQGLPVVTVTGKRRCPDCRGGGEQAWTPAKAHWLRWPQFLPWHWEMTETQMKPFYILFVVLYAFVPSFYPLKWQTSLKLDKLNVGKSHICVLTSDIITQVVFEYLDSFSPQYSMYFSLLSIFEMCPDSHLSSKASIETDPTVSVLESWKSVIELMLLPNIICVSAPNCYKSNIFPKCI